jgi:hypothetical protein
MVLNLGITNVEHNENQDFYHLTFTSQRSWYERGIH